VAKRVIKGLRHSGPSITITSFTNVMAFFIGATSSLKALSSFCIYTAVGILFLYFYTITFFSALFFMDL
jgi:predicted RND superfamily exporter protein